MRRTYMRILTEHLGMTQAQLARRLGWTQARVGYLCSKKAEFPFKQLWYIKKSLNLSDTEQIRILDEYFDQHHG